jgi:hypothetical protein
MKYTFTRIVARFAIAVGILLILAGTGFATIAIVPTSWIGMPFMPGSPDDPLKRTAEGIIIFLSGLSSGAFFIVLGQLMLMFVDIARRVARIDRRQRRRRQDEPPDESRWINRLRR